MRTCPECGHENNDTDRFCSNCGASLANDEQLPSSSTPPPPVAGFPTPVEFSTPPGASVEEEWRMSNLGPPPKAKRRLWLWILIGLVALCLLACVGMIAFSLTDTGQNWIEDVATEAAQKATEQAN